jgi:hypothetical protein
LLLAGVMDEMELLSISTVTPTSSNRGGLYQKLKYSQVLLMMGENITRNTQR